MSKKAKLLNQWKRAKQKEARKMSNKELIKNSESSNETVLIEQKRHEAANCYNFGCKRCYPQHHKIVEGSFQYYILKHLYPAMVK